MVRLNGGVSGGLVRQEGRSRMIDVGLVIDDVVEGMIDKDTELSKLIVSSSLSFSCAGGASC